jgi:hypothetical protein
MPGPIRKRKTPGNKSNSRQIPDTLKPDQKSSMRGSLRPSNLEYDLSQLGTLSSQERSAAVLALQQRYGNRRVQQMLNQSNRPDASPTVESSPASPLLAADREVDQDERNMVTPELTSAIEKERGGGMPLESKTRTEMEDAFGQDFSDVRVHTGSEADQLNVDVQARAFTTGKDVFFRSGTYTPESTAGKELLAHELTHVVQQSDSSTTGPDHITSPNDAVEREAANVAEAVVSRQVDEEEELAMARQVDEEEELAMARQVDEEEELAMARQVDEEEELAMARQVDEEEELAMARQVDEEATNPNIEITIAADKDAEWWTPEWYSELEVGHSWIDIKMPDQSEDSYGFWPVDVFNPKRPWRDVPGEVHNPDTEHPPTALLTEKITAEQLMNGLKYAASKATAMYNLLMFNCTTFAREMFEKATGKSAPSGGLLIDDPNDLHDSIEEQNKEAGISPLGQELPEEPSEKKN